MAYSGYVPAKGERLRTVPATIDARKMWASYIQPRRPVVLQGLLDDAAWKGGRWTDLRYLRDKAGDASVRVEPVHPEDGCFGTSTPRTTMAFGDYLDCIQEQDQSEQLYLTTQYEMDEPDENDDVDAGPALDPLLPSPTYKLADDFPLHPRLLGKLVLQQCNLWVGNCQRPRSSGLHHDFHDNLYLLLSGHKRFVLFPPSAYPALHLRGAVQKLHPNGVLVYEDPGRIRADGLDAIDAAHWRVAARARKVASKKRARTEQGQSARARYEEAKEAYFALRETYDKGYIEEGFAWSDDEDDDEGEGFALGDVSNDSATDGSEDHDAPPLSKEPPSFSRITPHTLHSHFGIHPAMPPPRGERDKLEPGTACPEPLVVDLLPGQMLYLPASWFHEVTSLATKDTPHMALNYWMHPPDGMHFDKPCTDEEVWDEVRLRV